MTTAAQRTKYKAWIVFFVLLTLFLVVWSVLWNTVDFLIKMFFPS